MEYQISKDIKLVRDLLDFTQQDLARVLEIDYKTINRIENGLSLGSAAIRERFYTFVYKKGIHLNEIKEMIYLEEAKHGKLLCHGSKEGLIGKPDINRSKKENDFGQGFYCGKSYLQAASFVQGFKTSRVYFFLFDQEGLKGARYYVDLEWLLTIAYFRNTLTDYKNSETVRGLLKKLEGIDYVIAPIADNRMFRIIDSFINGYISDEQCKHCLAASNLGYQYVFLNGKSLSNLEMIECCYISEAERNHHRLKREEDSRISEDKVKIAMIRYSGKGRFISEILNGKN